MRNSGFFLLIFTVMVVISSLAHATLAICPACKGAQPDWVASATDFLEGKPINNTPSGLNGPQQARFMDAQIDSKKNPSQALNAANNLVVTPTHNSTPMFDIDLNDMRAAPNPANLSDLVKIIVVFGNNRSNSQINATSNNLSTRTSLINMTVYASIKNLAGTEIGRVNLKRTSGNEYAGIWNVNVEPGAYMATIDASGSGGSKSFTDALQIVVSSSKNTTGSIHAFRKLG